MLKFNKKKIKALGIMNGTSLDAVDYALIELDSTLKKVRFLKHTQKSIPQNLRDSLLLCAQNQTTTYELAQLNTELGQLYGRHIKLLKKSWSWDIVGLHGQTVFHEGRKSTLQIGLPHYIYKECPKPVFFDFRSPDLVYGGQGAPFAPFFQHQLAKNSKMKDIAFHNLGGISNLTTIAGDKSLAFDTGPANILLDAWIKKVKNLSFDKGGKFSSQGLPAPLVVNEFLKHPFFEKKAPKSTGREDFNLRFIESWGGKEFKELSFEDQMATLTEVSALSIAKSYKSLKSLPRTIYFYGGGTQNTYLMKRIAFNLPNTEIEKSDSIGWPSQAMEASTFGFLAGARYFDINVHLPQLTGAKKKAPLGSVYL